MVYLMTSSERIIMKIMREFPAYNADLVNDTIEWIGEACEAIGYYGQTETKIAKICVKNYRGIIPCDLYRLNGEPSYNGFPLPYGTGNFRGNSLGSAATQTEFSSNNTFSNSDLTVNLELTRNQIVDKVIQATLFNYQANNNDNDSYTIQPGYFKTTFCEGTIYIDYEAYQRDENGFPMIPDYYEFIEAVAWYVKMKLIERGFQHPALKYGDAMQQWEKFESRAFKKAELPDRARMNSFVNQWNRLIPEVNPQGQFYENMRKTQPFINI